MRILRLVTGVGRTSVPYHQYTVPLLDEHHVTLCTYRPSGMQVDRRVQYEEGDGTLRGCVKRLVRLLRNGSYDVLHVHSPGLALLVMMVALVTRPTMLGRTILHVHGSFSQLRLLGRWMSLPAFLLSTRVVCCSTAARHSFPAIYRLVAGKRLMTIRHGVDVQRVDRVRSSGRVQTWIRSQDLELISVGSAHARKNYETLLRALAAARAPDVRLTIICGRPSVERLSRLADELGISRRVHLIGRASRDRVLQLLWSADAFVSMARDEGMPVSVLEAMGCQCPVALSDIPAHREICGPRRDLIPLFDSHDFQGLSATIDQWATTPTDVLRAWGDECRQHVLWNFSQEWLLQQFTVLLDQFSPWTSPEWDVMCRSLKIKQSGRRTA